MMIDADRIRLAEARGWQFIEHPADKIAAGGMEWVHAEHGTRIDCPDPEHDANDCEALIRHLCEQGYDVVISHNAGSPSNSDVDIYEVQALPEPAKWICNWSGDNWKQGVCELALKVIG